MNPADASPRFPCVRVLLNRRSGPGWSLDDLEQAMARHWEHPERDLSYAFTYSREDGQAKMRRAMEAGADVVLVGGGDGTLSSMGTQLLDTDVALGALPFGSGNGFARHFGIPLTLAEAAATLAQADIRRIDVGIVRDRPFLITCSMAWDAALVKAFDRIPFRGILPYVFAGVYTFFDYKPQPIDIRIDGHERLTLADPLVFTVANLSQYGGGAVIAPDAQPDDGKLALVAVCRQDTPVILANLDKVFSGRIRQIPRVLYRQFQTLDIRRPNAQPIQIDGELVEAPAAFSIRVNSRALNVLVPTTSKGAA